MLDRDTSRGTQEEPGLLHDAPLLSREPSRHEPLLRDLAPLKECTKLLIVGGTFDPFTRAHLEVPHHVAELVGADAVLYVPAKQNPLKSAAASASGIDRLLMIREALKAEPHSYVSPVELRREGSSYTIDTLREIRDEIGPGPELLLFLGSDCLPHLPEWRSLPEILSLATIIPVARGENAEHSFEALEGKLPQAIIGQLRANFIDVGDVGISATAARERLSHGELPWDLLPPAVIRFVEEKGLYNYAAST